MMMMTMYTCSARRATRSSERAPHETSTVSLSIIRSLIPTVARPHANPDDTCPDPGDAGDIGAIGWLRTSRTAVLLRAPSPIQGGAICIRNLFQRRHGCWCICSVRRAHRNSERVNPAEHHVVHEMLVCTMCTCWTLQECTVNASANAQVLRSAVLEPSHEFGLRSQLSSTDRSAATEHVSSTVALPMDTS